MLKVEKKYMAKEIVRLIKENVLESIDDAKGSYKHDPWDEEENGVGWLENEINFFNEINMIEDFYMGVNVKKCVKILSKGSETYLNKLTMFVLQGGTDSLEHWNQIANIRKNSL
jgi:hypothetical protein